MSLDATSRKFVVLLQQSDFFVGNIAVCLLQVYHQRCFYAEFNCTQKDRLQHLQQRCNWSTGEVGNEANNPNSGPNTPSSCFFVFTFSSHRLLSCHLLDGLTQLCLIRSKSMLKHDFTFTIAINIKVTFRYSTRPSLIVPFTFILKTNRQC